jgi:hypothetical protein
MPAAAEPEPEKRLDGNASTPLQACQTRSVHRGRMPLGDIDLELGKKAMEG